jgi:hypothetical protein
MKDIVQELREIQTTCPDLHRTFQTAANEILRLRGALEAKSISPREYKLLTRAENAEHEAESLRRQVKEAQRATRDLSIMFHRGLLESEQ